MGNKHIPYYSEKDTAWKLRTQNGTELGDIEYIISEFIRDNLIFRYHINGKACHSHTFQDVLITIIHNYNIISFAEFETDYSSQELRIIYKLIHKLKFG